MEKITNNYKIEFTKGDTFALAIKFKNITEDISSAFFTVKENENDAPLIQKTLGKGIDKIDDRSYKNEKTYKFQIQPIDTLYLEPRIQYLYDIKVTIGTVVKTVLKGVFALGNTITGQTKNSTESIDVEVDDEVEAEMATTPATTGVEYESDPVAIAKIGDMNTLTTTKKDTLVEAVNEVNTTAQKVVQIENGTKAVPLARFADNALSATLAEQAGSAGVAGVASALSGFSFTKKDNRYYVNGMVIPTKECLISEEQTIGTTAVCVHSGDNPYFNRKFEVRINNQFFTFSLVADDIYIPKQQQLIIKIASTSTQFSYVDSVTVSYQYNDSKKQYELLFRVDSGGGIDKVKLFSLYEIFD